MRWSAQPPHLLPLLLFTTVLNSVQHALSERLLAACGSVPSDRAILQPAATVGARRRSVFDRTCALILTASFETSVLPDQAPGAVTVVDESLCRPSVLRAVPRRPVVHETRAPCRPPGRRPEQAAAALPGGEAGGGHRRRYAERRAGRLLNLRQSGPRGGRVRGLPRRRARPLRRPPGRRGLRQVPDTPTFGGAAYCAGRCRVHRARRRQPAPATA